MVKDPATKKYTMGPGLFELSTMIFKRTDLATLAHPFLEQLAEQVGGNSHPGRKGEQSPQVPGSHRGEEKT